jgi:2-C-methyl-D-erythritol 4-phosphate cytidylyltransferase/2-C-methyl-D-erythritol 2,4-cyclodiphosphate synthase
VEIQKVAVLVVAAGSGTRFGAEKPKQYIDLGGRPLLNRTLNALLVSEAVNWVRPVISQDAGSLYQEAAGTISDDRLLDPVVGGATRQESVFLGLQSLKALHPDVVLIHDGARPFPTTDMIKSIIQALEDQSTIAGAYAVLPVTDTVREIQENGLCGKTLDREKLSLAQTPQGFRYQLIMEAHTEQAHLNLSDDVAIAMGFGLDVVTVPGNRSNLKVTTQEDLLIAETLLSQNKGAQMSETRIGMGYDVHRYDGGRPMFLCGVAFPESEVGLKGHSDADVALHAVTDALLGAIGAGDIGQHFPPTDPEWEGAASSVFIKEAMSAIDKMDGKVINVDLTIICEMPKINPRRQEMRESLARLLRVPAQAVNIKGTTTEGLGFTGRKEGIAAQAVVTVSIPYSGNHTRNKEVT